MSTYCTHCRKMYETQVALDAVSRSQLAALKAEIARLRELVEQVLADHADPQSPYYNDCDAPNNMCDWCGQATKALEATK